MSAEALEIIEPGLLTTVQDKGRFGFQRFGVPVSGAMDTFALRVANLLVSNDEAAAGLEMTVLGPKLRFLTDTWIAVTGADVDPVLDGEPLDQWKTIEVTRDSVLTFQAAKDGMRSYLAIAGGIDVPIVLRSRSTYVKAALGGLEGRTLKAGDVLHSPGAEPGTAFVERSLPVNMAAHPYGHEHVLRVVLGPQDKSFTQGGISTFLSSNYAVSIQSDRVGYRLEGPEIEQVSGFDIVSDGIPLGAVQVPGDGRPIVLMADRGTTGGYTKIATVISADIYELAQAMPGDMVTFKAIDVEDAQEVLRKQEEGLSSLRKIGAVDKTSGKFSVMVDGEPYQVTGAEGIEVALPGLLDKDLPRRMKATVGGKSYEFDVSVGQLD